MFVLVVTLCAAINGQTACISQAVPKPMIERRMCESVKDAAITGAVEGATDAGARVFWITVQCLNMGVTG